MLKRLIIFPAIALFALSCSMQDAGNVIPLPKEVDQLPGRGVSARCLSEKIETVITETGVPESEQGYVLEIRGGKATIKSRSEQGIFYGRQTLLQIAEDADKSHRRIQPMRITDWPDLEFRGIHIGYWYQIERKEYLYRLIDKLAKYKLNGFFFEIEDKLQYESHPEIASSLALSKTEMQELCEYAHDRYVEIDPLVQGLSHAFYILKHHPELRESPEDLFDCCPSNPALYDFLFSLYDEAIEAMPYCRFVHVGGDEVEKIGICQRCRVKGKNAMQLQMEWMNKVADHIVSRGKIPVFWDDMPLRNAGLMDLVSGSDSRETVDSLWNAEKLKESLTHFPKEARYVRWWYEDADQPGEKKVLEFYDSLGIHVFAATAADNGAQKYMPRPDSRLEYIKGFSKVASDNRLDGIFSTYWQDKGAITEFSLRGFIGQGEFGWNSTGRDVKSFIDAHAKREFGFNPEDSLMSFLPKLENSMDFLDTAFVYKHGNRKTVIELPEGRYPGKWAEKHSVRLEEAARQDSIYFIVKKGLEKAVKKATGNQYTLRMYEQNNEHQHFDVSLLLALKEYDLAGSPEDRIKALEKVSDVCGSFDSMRKNLEKVFSESCELDMPEDYLLVNWGVLPSLSKDFSWNYHYEIPMVENVRKWVEEQKPSEFRMVLRCWQQSFNDKDLSERTITQLKKYPVFDEMWMFVDDTADCKAAKAFGDKLLSAGLAPCYEQRTLGHGDPTERRGLDFLYGDYVTAATYDLPGVEGHEMTGPDGTKCKTQSCPRAEVFLNDVRTLNSAFSKTLMPERVMIDDDLRMYNHKPVESACFCDRCISEFNSETGGRWTRESLVKALKNPANSELRGNWVHFGESSLGHVAAEAARAVHSVSPRTDVGLENGCNTMVPLTGGDLRPVFDSIYAVTGIKPTYRPGAGFYRDYAPREMIVKANDLARQMRRLPEYVTAIPAEIEGYHHIATGKSPDCPPIESMLYLAMGATQLSYALSSSSDEPIEWYADNYFRRLRDWKTYFREFTEHNRWTEPGGLDRYISPTYYLRIEDVFSRIKVDEHVDRFQAIGFPITPGGHYACAYVMGEFELSLCSREELDGFMSKGLVLDPAAFSKLNEFGYGDSLEQTDDLDGVRFVSTYTTDKGGRIAVIPTLKPTNINIKRRRELQLICDWVSFGKMPVIAETMSQMMFVPRISYNGRLMSVTALNCTISDSVPVTIRLRGCGEARSFILKKAGEKDRKLNFHKENNDMIVTIPSLEDWNIAWIQIKY